MTPIPFNQCASQGREAEYLAPALESGSIGGGGRFAARCQQLLKRQFDSSKALLTTSCTHSLERSSLLLNIQPGDRVIPPTYTFISTANAFVLQGARPVLHGRLTTGDLERVVDGVRSFPGTCGTAP
ncbi:MAG: DegT/DnrJ/EryC1/StrS family aminotransferase [Planctomycetales bacterium]